MVKIKYEYLFLVTIFIISTCGLIYELIAGTLASYLLGDSVMQFSLIIGIYLFSMGVGSFLSKFFTGDKLISRFVEIEILIGLIGGLSAPLLFLIFNKADFFEFYLYLIVFLIGLIAAAYSSADSALTSLTTSFCVDIIDNTNPKTRIWVHIGMSLVLVLMIILFKQINSSSVIKEVFNFAGLTYGPLLGLFSFGIFTRLNIKDNLTPFIAIFSVISSFLLHKYSKFLFNDYQIGFEILLINALITFLLLLISRKKLSN